MTIKEIEKLSGMERANIRFYEREGLISPKRMNNGYRDYSQDDLQILLRIKLLRSLHISLDEIKALKCGSKELPDTLTRQIKRLAEEKHDAAYAQDVCRTIQQDRVDFANLDAKKYLDGINRVTKETGSAYFTVKGDELPQVFRPLRRFLARTLDIFIYNLLWSVFLAFALHVNLMARSNLGNIFDSFVAIAILLILEPLCLHLFGTTLGKAIFGLRIETPDGRNLSYREGLKRTWGVIGAGLGYNIPIYSLVRLWKSYRLCSENEIQPWDESISYILKDTKRYRSALYIFTYAVLVFLMVVTIYAQRLPPNRGDLTVTEFVENYNYYAELYDIEFRSELDKNGEWMEKNDDGTVYIELSHMELPEYKFTTENGHVTGISFGVEIRNNRDWLSSYETQMVLSSLAFAGAQNSEMGLFSKIPGRIVGLIQINNLRDFSFTEAGILFSCDTEYSGYRNMQSGMLQPKENAMETYFSLDFSMSKVE